MQTFFPLFSRQRASDPSIAYHMHPVQQSYPISNYPNNYHNHNPYYNIDEPELYISDQHFSSDEYQNNTSEEPVCCPHEIQKSKVHRVSPNSRVRKQFFIADRNRLPKFRDPWRYLDQSTQSHTEQPLSRDEARRIREIWQDTRAQYDPSDHEIEEEYLYEEEYNDENAEKRRIELVEKGAKLVRYSYHYQLPTISALIKSTNPEQFRSRALSPIAEACRSPKHNQQGDEINNEGFEEQKADEPFIGRTYHRSTYPIMGHNNRTENSFINDNWVYHNQESNEDHYQNQAHYNESLDYSKTNPNENLLLSSNEHDVIHKLGIKDNYTPSHRHSTTGFEYETPPQSGHRRLTSPAALLSTERSINRRPPPQISILEPIDTTEELVSPVTTQGRNYKTPRIGKITSQDDNKLNYSSGEIESGKEKPLLESPSGKQTIVFHMLPYTNVNSSSATILADPDTQNIVTEIHITPGVDINITSTPSGPSIEYEVSKEKTAKAQINFSSESTTKLIPKRKENISNARNNADNFSGGVSNSIEEINNKKNHFQKVDKGGINSVIDSEYTTQDFPHSYEPKINTDDYEVQLHSSNNLNNSSREKKKMAFQNQKHSNGYPNRLLNMLTCSNIETADLHTFRSLTPVEVKTLKH